MLMNGRRKTIAGLVARLKCSFDCTHTCCTTEAEDVSILTSHKLHRRALPKANNNTNIPKMRTQILNLSLLAATAGTISASAVHDVVNGRALRGLLAYNGGLSKQELRCSIDTRKMYGANPDLQQLVLGVGDSMDVQEQGLAIEMTLKDDYVANLTAACAKASGLFLPMDDADFVCDYQGIEVEVLVVNFAQLR